MTWRVALLNSYRSVNVVLVIEEAALKEEREFPGVVWLSSSLFSLVILAGYRVLEQREFLSLIALLGVLHVLSAARFARPARYLFLSQALVVVVTLVSVALHVASVVGPAPSGWWTTLGSFIKGSWTNPTTYLYFGAHALAFCLALTALLLGIRIVRVRSKIDSKTALVTAYAMASVNVAIDYSLARPLYHVSGDPDAIAFFFAAGLFGVEFSLPLYLLVLVLCCLWVQWQENSRQS